MDFPNFLARFSHKHFTLLATFYLPLQIQFPVNYAARELNPRRKYAKKILLSDIFILFLVKDLFLVPLGDFLYFLMLHF